MFALGVALFGPLPAPAQTSDPVLDLLVEKGVITKREADNARREADRRLGQGNVIKSTMPDWVTAVKFSGDLRMTFEQQSSDNAAFIDRNRYRYRLRLGVTVSMLEDYEVGVRLTSANPAPGGIGFGGNPLSNNADLGNNGSKKFIFLDTVYAKWSPVHSDGWEASAMLGKFDNPFTLSPLVWDPNYQPEGLALHVVRQLDERHRLTFNGALFILDEFNQATPANPSASHDPFVAGAQLTWSTKWTPKWESEAGVSVFAVAGGENLSNTEAPNVNTGNTRTPAGLLTSHFNPVVVNAALTRTFEGFPLARGEFPVKVWGEYLNNPAARAANEGWAVGLTLGKLARKGSWELSYKYERLEADAWYEELPDDDFGAFYQTPLGGSGLGAGYFGGTNVRGHVARLNYRLADSLTFSTTWFLTRLVESPAGALSDASHLFVELMWSF